MTYEMTRHYMCGGCPPDCYRVPETVAEMIETIETLGFGGVVTSDAPPGHGFTFGRTVGGKWWFATDEFLDDDERTPNPDFHETRFETVADGVAHFTINGKPLFECARGCAFWQSDCGCALPD